MKLREKYDDLSQFIEDIHECVSVKQLALDMGVYTKDDFRGQMVCCCFHEEKTPSMQLTDHFFRCYACGVKGDAITFVQQYCNTGFVEAVRKIAESTGVDISGVKMKFDGKMSELTEEWNGYLMAMESAPEAAKAMQRDFFPQELGYDRREGYVVLPLTSKTGAVLGFTKRRVDALFKKDGKHFYTKDGKNAPKWKHSTLRDSLIDQCHNLFNLHNAAPVIRKTGRVVMNEGPKDVIAWRRVGVEYAVGVCGTSNSNNVWDSVLPVETIFLSYDGDEAGVKTALSSTVYLASQHDINHVFVLRMPEGKDPYDVMTEQGNQALLDILASPVPAAQFVCKFGSLETIADLYEAAPEHHKITVLSALCKAKRFSPSEAEAYLQSASVKPLKKKSEMGEKEQLIAAVRGEGDGSIRPDKAERVLRMKYGVKVEEVLHGVDQN